MSDFLKVISLLEQELKAAQQDLQVRTSFSSQPKPLPFEKTAIITIEKAECASAGLAGIVREGQFPTGKREAVVSGKTVLPKRGGVLETVGQLRSTAFVFAKTGGGVH